VAGLVAELDATTAGTNDRMINPIDRLSLEVDDLPCVVWLRHSAPGKGSTRLVHPDMRGIDGLPVELTGNNAQRRVQP